MRLGVRPCSIFNWTAEYALVEEAWVDAPTGRLAYLPAGVSAPDPGAFLSDVLTGRRRAQFAKNFCTDAARRRAASVLRMTEFVGSYPWQWTPTDADDFFGHLRGVRPTGSLPRT